ncbi:MAG: trypsin-like peptidase domain-containing protein [bacterium]
MSRQDRVDDHAPGRSDADGSPDLVVFERPAGVAGSFDRVPAGPPPTSPYRPEPPEAREVFARPSGPGYSGEPFAPAIGDRLPPRHRPAGSDARPGQAAAFGRPDGAGAFDPAPGSRLDQRPAASARWWKADAEHDPWRNPSSPFWLGRPALFLDNRPVAIEDGESVEEPQPAEDELDGPSAASSGRARFGLTTLVLVVLAALVAGAVGAGLGYLATKRTDEALRDPDINLATVAPAAPRAPGTVADVAKRVGPAVVQVAVRGATETGTGSGVVIDGQGYILTNNHVVSDAASGGTIRVVFSDSSVALARIVGRDPSTDLAVIKVQHSPLTVAALGNSDSLAVGDDVLAIGSPLGLAGTVTTGIVSRLHRAVRVNGEGSDTDAVIDAIQTDAAINPGNSGGALVNRQGAVVGITSAIASLTTNRQGGSIGLGFAIPITAARDIATQLIKNGKAVHATFGANTRSVTDGTRLGAYIVQVLPDGPASQSGLREGDVVKLIDGALIATSEDLSVAIGRSKPGAVVEVRYTRGAKESTVKVTLGADS